MEVQAILIFIVIFGQPLKSTAVYHWIRIQRFKTIIFCFNCVYNSWKYVLYPYQAVNVKCEWKFCMYFSY